MKFDPTRHGRGSQAKGNPAVLEAWDHAAKVTSPLGEWVPWESVWIRDEISPRDGARTDQEFVERYREHWEMLPPIKVERHTFALIDGWHRIQAVSQVSDLILIEEIDIPEGETIEDHAVRANTGHGNALRTSDRVKAAASMLDRHWDWSDGRIAQWCGVNRSTVIQYRQRLAAKRAPESGEENQPVGNQQVETRIGVDGRARQVAPARPERPAVTPATRPDTVNKVSSFDPGAESEPDDPFYDNDAEGQGVGTEWEPRNLTPLDPPAEVPAVDTGAVKWADSAPEIPEGMSAEEAELFGYGKQPEPTYMRKPDVYEPLSAAQADFLVASFERIAKRALWIDRDWYGLTTEQRGRVRACIDESFMGMSALMQELKSAAVGGS